MARNQSMHSFYDTMLAPSFRHRGCNDVSDMDTMSRSHTSEYVPFKSTDLDSPLLMRTCICRDTKLPENPKKSEAYIRCYTYNIPSRRCQRVGIYFPMASLRWRLPRLSATISSSVVELDAHLDKNVVKLERVTRVHKYFRTMALHMLHASRRSLYTMYTFVTSEGHDAAAADRTVSRT